MRVFLTNIYLGINPYLKYYLLFFVGFFLAFSWLSVDHYKPWVVFYNEFYAAVAIVLSMFFFINKNVKIPIIVIPLVFLSIVPLIHFFIGKVFYFSIGFMGFIYVSCFWLAIIIGFNLSTSIFNRIRIFHYLSRLFISVGILTSIIAIFQWLNFEQYIPWIREVNEKQRPYGNFAQPNNMATFLIMSLMACLYLHESKKINIKLIIISAIIILIGIALSQSRTAWLVSIVIYIYLSIYQYKGIVTLKWYYSTLWFLLFILFIFTLPLVGQAILYFTDLQIVQSRDVIYRATSDISRLGIWKHLTYAIAKEPWWGYGWYQTSVAFSSVTEVVQGTKWVRNAHNFIIDFLLWNGLFIGIPFLLYFCYVGFFLQKDIISIESVVGMLMVGAFLNHAMFEFPQHYTFFLIPVGFIIGMMLAQKKELSVFIVNSHIYHILLIFSILVLIMVYRDYEIARAKILESILYQKQPQKIQIENPIFLLTEFNHRIAWIRTNPYSIKSLDEIKTIGQLINSYPIEYNIKKYAKLLAFNGYEKEAKHQLWRLKVIWKVDLSYEELIKDMPY